MSVTGDLSTAQTFADGKDGYIFKIKMPKGSKTIDVESYRGIEAFDNIASGINDESEFILQRGSNLKINNIDKSGYQTIVECEYTGSTPKKVVPVKLNTPEEIVDFNLEKFYAHPDAASDKYMAKMLGDCFESGRNDDAYHIIELLKDRISFQKNPVKLSSDLINCKNNNIISSFDSAGEYTEMIDLLKYMVSSSKSAGSFINVGGIITDAMQNYGLDLSIPCMKALIDNGFLPSQWANYL